MFAKIIKAADLALPGPILQQMGNPAWFHVSLDGARLVFTPAVSEEGDAVREYLSTIGITEEDVDEAIQWARIR